MAYLGLDYNKEDNKTEKFLLKELRTFIKQENRYNNAYHAKIIEALAGDDNDVKQAINYFLAVDESLLRYLNAKNYYTLASHKRGYWGFLVFYGIPQLACMFSMLKSEYHLPCVLLDYDFMLPIAKGKRAVLPVARFKNYVACVKVTQAKVKENERLKGLDLFDDYFDELKNSVTPRHQTKHIILKKIRKLNDQKLGSISDIEIVFNCTIFASHLYHDGKKYFGNTQSILMLADYFRDCFETCNQWYLKRVFKKQDDPFKGFMAMQLDLLMTELEALAIERHRPDIMLNNNGYPAQMEIREGLFNLFHTFLVETSAENRDVLEPNNAGQLRDWLIGHKPGCAIQVPDEEHVELLSTIKSLNVMFNHHEKALNDSEVSGLLDRFKSSKFLENYEHEYFYYMAMDNLARNNLPAAIENLKLAGKKCDEITAGQTKLYASKWLIMLRLLMDNKIDYSHLNPEIKAYIDAQPEETVGIVFPNPDTAKNHQQIYFEKTLKIIKDFNRNGYCRYLGVERLTYNPFEKMDAWLTDLFQLYDEQESLLQTDRERLEFAINSLMRGRRVKYPINKPVVRLLQYPPGEALNNLAYVGCLCRDLNLLLPAMERLFGIPPDFIEQLKMLLDVPETRTSNKIRKH